MQSILFAYQVSHCLVWFGQIFTTSETQKKIITLKELEDFIFQTDIRETLKFATRVDKDEKIKEAYLCLHALIEHFDVLQSKNQKMWILNSYRIGDITLLAKDITCWNQKLLTRLILQ